MLSYSPIVVKLTHSRKLTINKDNSLKTRYYLSFLLILFFQEILFPQQKGMRIQLREGGDEIQIYDDSWALIIGINKYTNWPPLDYAVNDANSIRDLLINKFGFKTDHIFLLTDEDATLRKIKDTLSDLGEIVGKNDRVIIYFSGHGQSLDLESGGQMGFLIPVDGSTKNNRLYSSSLAMSDIKAISNFIPAKHILYLVDACYSGLLASTQKGLSTNDKLYLRQITLARGRQIITAGGKGEVSYERPEWGHGAFTYKLLEGLETGLADLNDDGIITSSELGNYLKSKVPRISNFKQTPRFKYLTDDEGEFVFLIKRRDYKSIADSEIEKRVNISPKETGVRKSEPGKAALDEKDDANSSDIIYSELTKNQHPTSIGFSIGPAEPWGDPGVGEGYGTGISIFSFIQQDFLREIIGSDLNTELAIGYTTFPNKFAIVSANSNVLLVMINGLYKIVRISSSVEMFGFGGLGVNYHSWTTGINSKEIDSQTVLGINVGFVAKILISQKINLNLKWGYYKSMTSRLTSGGWESQDDYNHAMVSPMLGISYRLGI